MGGRGKCRRICVDCTYVGAGSRLVTEAATREASSVADKPLLLSYRGARLEWIFCLSRDGPIKTRTLLKSPDGAAVAANPSEDCASGLVCADAQ